MHTAYVLMASLDRSPAAHRTGSFYLRRAFRIYPLAIAAIALMAVTALPASADLLRDPRAVPLTRHGVVSNLLLVENLNGQRDILGVLWSLPLEVQMYVLLPLCFLFARRSVWQTIALWAVAVALGLWQIHSTTRGVWRLNVLAFGPCFVAGIVAWSVRRREPSTRVLPAWCWLPLLLGALALMPLLHPDPVRIERGWPICVLVALLIVSVRELDPSWLTRAARVIAEYSFGIYLFHTPAIGIAFVWGHTLPVAARWGIYVTLLVAMPWLGYRVIERPGIAIGKHVAARWARANAPRSEVAGEPTAAI